MAVDWVLEWEMMTEIGKGGGSVALSAPQRVELKVEWSVFLRVASLDVSRVEWKDDGMGHLSAAKSVASMVG